MKTILKLVLFACLVALIFLGPLLFARYKYPATLPDDLAVADVAIVFGAVVRNDTISPLHEQRLKAAIDLLDRKVVPKIVVSNTQRAAETMARYLEEQGVSKSVIEMDIQADQTIDTCRYEVKAHQPRKVILISQGFHIPRLSMQCKWEGLRGQSVAAELYRSQRPSELSKLRIIRIRATRHLREAALLWTAIFGFYDGLSDA